MMRNGRWIAIALGVAVLVAGGIGWRGSRPSSPTAAAHSDGVTVVPATGTLPRIRAAPAAPRPTPVATATPAAPAIVLGVDEVERLPRRFAEQPRDPAWAPVAETRLRTAFADVPHLAGPLRVVCATTLCEIAGSLPPGLSPTDTDAALGMLQGSAMARTRPDFADNTGRFEQIEGGATLFTIWFVRR